MQFKSYPEYKDSGVEWLDEVPAHWNTKPIKYVSNINAEVLAESTNYNYEIQYVDISSVSDREGISTREAFEFGNAPSRARRVVKDGDIIISTVRTYLKAIAYIQNPPDNLIVSTGFAVITPIRKSLSPEFAKYAFLAEQFLNEIISKSKGISYPAITSTELADIAIAIPSRIEQTQVVSFLDQETTKIDLLISKQENLIELLEEQRKSIISHAITKGLDPDVPMKDSGVEWLGDVPAHWEVRPLKYTSKINSEVLSETTAENYEIQYVDISNVNDKDGISGSELFEFKSAPSRARRKVKDGDIIISTVRTYLRAIAYIQNPPDNLIVSTGFAVISPMNNILSSIFAKYAFLTEQFLNEIISKSKGISYPAITSTELADIAIPVPASDEQGKIAIYLDQETAKIDNAISRQKLLIEKLKEYRSSVISHAVTGKIDVRDLAT